MDLQMQRRAIESLRPYAESLPSIGQRTLVLDDGKPLEICGVSKGVGTCSDIHGMYVLVLAEAPEDYCTLPRIPRGVSVDDCSYAVLFQYPTKSSTERIVDLLRVAEEQQNKLILSRTGINISYVVLV